MFYRVNSVKLFPIFTIWQVLTYSHILKSCNLDTCVSGMFMNKRVIYIFFCPRIGELVEGLASFLMYIYQNMPYLGYNGMDNVIIVIYCLENIDPFNRSQYCCL